jgi:RHS repeat-associated protein
MAPVSQVIANRWRYSGKEEQAAALDPDLPLIDYGARMYDPAIARWMSVDPMAEKYYPISPYAYCAGNRWTWWIRRGGTGIEHCDFKDFDFSVIENVHYRDVEK